MFNFLQDVVVGTYLPVLLIFEALMDVVSDEIQRRANNAQITDVLNLATMRHDLATMGRTIGSSLPVVRCVRSLHCTCLNSISVIF